MTLLKAITPISKIIGKIHAPFSERLLTGKDFYKIIELIKPGDILLSRTRYHLTNIFIPGFFKHSSLIVDKNNIIESTAEGVHLTSLYDFISTKDYIGISRLNSLYSYNKSIDDIVKIAIKQLGKFYDYEFSSDDKQFYCAELIYFSYLQNGIKLLEPKNYITPQDIYNSSLLNLIYISRSLEHNNGKD
jgi:uncharacterized protein YycO